MDQVDDAVLNVQLRLHPLHLRLKEPLMTKMMMNSKRKHRRRKTSTSLHTEKRQCNFMCRIPFREHCYMVCHSNTRTFKLHPWESRMVWSVHAHAHDYTSSCKRTRH